MDCPEDVDTYIHRENGEVQSRRICFVVADARGKKMVELLQKRKIPIEVLEINPTKRLSIKVSLQELLLQDSEIKILAQKAVRSYLKSIHLMANKEVFDVQKLPHSQYAASLGLMGVPQIKFVEAKKVDKHEMIVQQNLERLYEGGEETDFIPIKPRKKYKTKVQKLLERKNDTVLAESVLKMIDEEENDDIFVKKN